MAAIAEAVVGAAFVAVVCGAAACGQGCGAVAERGGERRDGVAWAADMAGWAEAVTAAGLALVRPAYAGREE